MYFRLTYSNGYCGCEETEYAEFENESEAWDYLLEEGIYLYDFYEPDDRFVNEDDYESDEEYYEAVEEYQDAIHDNSYVTEITKEEYEEEAR